MIGNTSFKTPCGRKNAPTTLWNNLIRSGVVIMSVKTPLLIQVGSLWVPISSLHVNEFTQLSQF